jgi:hypothetical protein
LRKFLVSPNFEAPDDRHSTQPTSGIAQRWDTPNVVDERTNLN